MSQSETGQRIAPLEPPYSEEFAAMFARVMPPGREPLTLFRTMARSPRVLQRMFAGNLLDKSSLSLRERELVILRTCARCGSEYEWGVHVTFFSDRAGLGKEQVAATLAEGNGNALTEREALLLSLVDALHDQARIDDALWARLEQHYTAGQLLELIALTGYYHTISYMTNGLRIGNESYAARFSDYRNE